MRPHRNSAKPADAIAARSKVRRVTRSEILAHLPSLNEFVPHNKFYDFGIEWQTVAEEALEVMAQGRDLLVTASFMSDPGKPLPILPLLEGLTKIFCRAAFYREIPFEPTKLWDFVGCVERWGCGDRTPEVFARAKTLFNIAVTDLNRLSAKAIAEAATRRARTIVSPPEPAGEQDSDPRAENAPSEAVETSNRNSKQSTPPSPKPMPREEQDTRPWVADGRIRATLEAVGHRLTTTELLAEMSKIHPLVSESAAKKRLAVMVRERRLTNNEKAKPPGYGLPEWSGLPGS
jgi:hypothetical protein